MLLHYALAAPLLLMPRWAHLEPHERRAATCVAEQPPPSIAECLEASFVPAVMGLARGDVTELKLFIASAQAGHRAGEQIGALSTAMDALPVQTAGRPLAPEESELRAQWIGLAYLTLESLGTDAAETASTLVPSAVRAEYLKRAQPASF